MVISRAGKVADHAHHLEGITIYNLGAHCFPPPLAHLAATQPKGLHTGPSAFHITTH
jgi:hypothetical protein